MEKQLNIHDIENEMVKNEPSEKHEKGKKMIEKFINSFKHEKEDIDRKEQELKENIRTDKEKINEITEPYNARIQEQTRKTEKSINENRERIRKLKIEMWKETKDNFGYSAIVSATAMNPKEEDLKYINSNTVILTTGEGGRYNYIKNKLQKIISEKPDVKIFADGYFIPKEAILETNDDREQRIKKSGYQWYDYSPFEQHKDDDLELGLGHGVIKISGLWTDDKEFEEIKKHVIDKLLKTGELNLPPYYKNKDYDIERDIESAVSSDKIIEIETLDDEEILRVITPIGSFETAKEKKQKG